MELTPTQLANLQAITLTSSKVRLGELSVGQQLLAKVIASNPNGEVTLNINNAILNARTALTLTEGQLLQLVVAQTGKQILLQLPQKALQEALTQQILRESLPKQQPLNQTVNLVRQVLQEATQLNLPQPVRQAMQHFVQQIPTSKQLENPESLRQAVRNSGVFLEHSISQALSGKNAIASNDMKALLTHLKNLLTSQKEILQQAPPQAREIKPAVTQQPTSSQQTTFIKHEVAKEITSQTLLHQSRTDNKAIGNNTQTNTTTNVKTPPQPTPQQTQTAIKTTSEQTVTQSLSQSKSTQTPLPPLSPFVTGKTPGIIRTDNYNSGRQAASIKEALAINSITPSTPSESGQIAARFSNLIELLDQLIKQVESSLARTQLHQLNTLQDQDAGKLAWSMEIPVQQDDETHLVKLDIEKENQHGDADALVTVNLAVNLEKLGMVYSKLTLKGKNVGVVFWAEREHTFNLASQSLPELETNLEKSGFTTARLNLHHGQPPQVHTPEHYLPDNLLDIKV